MSYLSINNIVKKFGSKVALNDVSLNVNEGEFLCFLGPSGCGKTTLLNAICGISFPTSGTISLMGNDITTLAPEKRHFGVVFQNYALFPNLTVKDNICYGLKGLSKNEKRDRTLELLKLVELEEYIDYYPTELSGGQQQRIALARALAPKPKLLLLDEPLSALDARIRVTLAAQIRRIQQQLGITTIMVTHDQQEAMFISDRIVLMNNGVIEQIGSPKEVYTNPTSLFAASFVGDMNFIKNRVDNTLKCIRYEHVKVQEANEYRLSKPHTHTARIEKISFLGKSARIELLMQDYITRIFCDIKLPAPCFLEEGAIVAVTLPTEHTHVWNDHE